MFNLQSFVQDALICLRCQYRLGAKGSLRHRPSHSLRNSEQLRHFAPGRSHRQEPAPVNNVAPLDGGLAGPFIQYDPISNSFRRRYKEISTKDLLGLDALGKPAEVLILRDREKRARQHVLRSDAPDQNPPVEAEMTPSEMLDEIDAERGIIDTDQVCENIENIRRSELAKTGETSRVLTIEEYTGLADMLREGFTGKQLSAYLDTVGSKQPADSLDLYQDFSSPLYSRSSWSSQTMSPQQLKAPKTGKTAHDRQKNGQLAAEQAAGVSNKDRLVDKILRQCWQLRSKREDSVLGEMDIRLQPTHLDLISNHKRNILKQISQNYDVKVEASPRDQVIRITSDYETCVEILKLFDYMIGNVCCSKMDISHLARSARISAAEAGANVKDEAVFRHVEQLTNTTIKPSHIASTAAARIRELDIYYLGPDDTDFQDARKLINQSLRPTSVKGQKLISASAISSSKAILVPVEAGSGLSLVNRTQQWSRWCNPMVRKVDMENGDESGLASLNTSRSPLKSETQSGRALSQFFVVPSDEVYEISKEMRCYWEPKPSYYDSALLGQVLFPTSMVQHFEASMKHKGKKGKKGTKREGFNVKLGKWDREFVTLVPGLLSSLESLGPTRWSEEFLQIRLTPSLNSEPVSIQAQNLPDLDIRIFFDMNSKTTSIGDVRLVTRKELDVLLPENTMDIKFIRRSCVYARRKNIDPCIHEFVKSSKLDIWGTERLETPPNLTLSVPAHAIRSYENVEKPNCEHDTLVDYSFASLEHKCELGLPSLQSGSWADLTYTSIEAGRLGGRRDELCLQRTIKPLEYVSVNRIADAAPEEEEEEEDASVNDDFHSASLLRKANFLVNHIENRPETGNNEEQVYEFFNQEDVEPKTAKSGKKRETERPKRPPKKWKRLKGKYRTVGETQARRCPPKLKREIRRIFGEQRCGKHE